MHSNLTLFSLIDNIRQLDDDLFRLNLNSRRMPERETKKKTEEMLSVVGRVSSHSFRCQETSGAQM